MSRYFFLACNVLFCLMALAQQPANSSTKTMYEFVPNAGQFHPLARYKSNIPYGTLYLESASIVYDLIKPEDYTRIQEWKHQNPALPNQEIPTKHSVRIRFVDVDFASDIEALNIQNHYYNYFLGKDKSRWVSKIHPAGDIRYNEVYPDIDFEISGAKSIKYQWVIRNPTLEKIAKIRCSIEGADDIKIQNGQLQIETSAGILEDSEPFVYQEINGEIVELNSRYVLTDSILSYGIQSAINPDYPLIIDPELIFSTYSGSVGDNFGYTATYDSRGNLYAGGIVDDRGDYPVTSGAFDTTWNGGQGLAPAGLPCDVCISKYDSAGSTLLWASYLGGETDEYPHSLVADRNDDLLIFGTTYSDNFPLSTGCFDSTHGGLTDIYVSKLSEDGTTLLGSTFIGGNLRDGLTLNDPGIYKPGDLKYNYSDDYRGDIITDDDGNIFVATTARSASLPVVNEVQSDRSGSLDGYLFELNPDCSQMLWGTYFGGVDQDAFYSIKLDNFNRIIVGGGTGSADIVGGDSTLATSNNGGIDGIIAVFDKTDKSLLRATHWGTDKYDQIYFIDTDQQGRIYASGQTEGLVTKSAGTYGESGKGQFIFRIDSSLQTVDLQTTFGNTTGKPNLVPSAFLVDVCDHIYFSGWGSPVDNNFHPGSTTGMPVSNDAVQKVTDGQDFYVIVFGRDAEELLYATYFGGDSTGDHVDGGTSRFDKKGVVYQSVCSSCPEAGRNGYQDFPTTSGAAFETNPSVRCSNASFKIDLQIKSAVIADFIVAPPIGCVPLTTKFTNKSILGNSYIWDFGDGTTSTVLNPIHTYQNVGTYTATLTVIDSNTCNISSVYKRTIEVLELSQADFSVRFDGCDNKLVIENSSVNGANYVWDFGDSTFSEAKTPQHKYEDLGSYIIKLEVNKGTPCESFHAESVTIVAKKTPEIKLYNVFTPNRDGLNDCFVMDGVDLDCQVYSLKIYNRWGEQVFETEDPLVCWTGNVYGQEELLPEGTYFYVLQLGLDKTKAISGVVEMVH